ncbi:hypothetical protein RJ641_033975, partial [Dillenia turbinata]
QNDDYFRKSLETLTFLAICTILLPMFFKLLRDLLIPLRRFHDELHVCEALELLKILMINPFVIPDNSTYPSVIKACGGLRRITDGKILHTHLIKAGILSLDVVVTSSQRRGVLEHSDNLFLLKFAMRESIANL